MKLAPIIFACITCLPLSAIAQEAPMEPQKLAGMLREGGYVILVRHAASDATQKDAENLYLTIARPKEIYLAKVESTLAVSDKPLIPYKFQYLQYFLALSVELWIQVGWLLRGSNAPNELNHVKDTEDDKRKSASLLNSLLSAIPTSGSNTVLITHSTNIQATLGFVPAEGEAVIFKPEGNSYKLVGRIRAQQWSEIKP